MRTIKFRVWDTDEKRFITKSSLQVEGNDCCLVLHLDGDLVDIAYDRDERHNEYPVEQFTGLLDKNGKEIYEGDIVRCQSRMVYLDGKPTGDEDAINTYEIFYHPIRCIWFQRLLTSNKGKAVGRETDISYFHSEYYEIIGNIHETK